MTCGKLNAASTALRFNYPMSDWLASSVLAWPAKIIKIEGRNFSHTLVLSQQMQKNAEKDATELRGINFRPSCGAADSSASFVLLGKKFSTAPETRILLKVITCDMLRRSSKHKRPCKVNFVRWTVKKWWNATFEALKTRVQRDEFRSWSLAHLVQNKCAMRPTA